jgi:archaellum biogenesis ATPase FlaH
VFTVACDLAARGWQFEVAEAAIMARAERLDLTADEIADLPRQIRNAYAQPREPVLDEPVRVIPADSSKPGDKPVGTPEEPAAGSRLVTLRQAIGRWKDHEEEEAIRVVPLFKGIMPDGLPTGQIVCVAAPPALGKTALALQLVASALMLDPTLVAVWCMGEMTEERLAERIIACNAPMHLEDVRQRCRAAIEAADSIADRIGDRLQILPDPLRTAEIAESVEATGARLVVVDYLQLVRGAGKQADRRQEVDGALRDLRSLTTSKRLSMVVISNLAKGVTRLENPDSLDIGKESSEIGFQADVVLYGTSPAIEIGDGTLVEWHCKKNRHGPAGTTELVFYPRQMRFAPSVNLRQR